MTARPWTAIGRDTVARECELLPHPASTTPAVQRLQVQVCRSAGAPLALSFLLEGDCAGLRLPVPGTARRADGLWQHTCFEALVGIADGPAYRELNFAPSGEWALYAFRRYREPASLVPARAPQIVVVASEQRLALRAVLGAEHLPPTWGTCTLRIALAAVIEDRDGTLSYWALRHPPGRPDFHHEHSFGLTLGAPPASAGGEGP